MASQTLENMSVISSATSLPVLRPLIAMDGPPEITAEACVSAHTRFQSFLMRTCVRSSRQRHPATRATLRDVEAAERSLPVGEMVHSAVSKVRLNGFSIRPRTATTRW